MDQALMSPPSQSSEPSPRALPSPNSGDPIPKPRLHRARSTTPSPMLLSKLPCRHLFSSMSPLHIHIHGAVLDSLQLCHQHPVLKARALYAVKNPSTSPCSIHRRLPGRAAPPLPKNLMPPHQSHPWTPPTSHFSHEFSLSESLLKREMEPEKEK
ncbi:hypothetical protein M0R45_019536 [Rubus argutus]|uniref:Uncharacterized protein n=1 Tax=Rubus argutus TaxID=59490 RepID=A0AAW1X8E3_RUBAR